MNRVKVIIEADHGEDMGARRVEASAVFDSPDFTLPQVLSVFERGLRGAGYHVDTDGLTAHTSETP